MAKKPVQEEHENHERWLVSYADFITLLFAFFVVMYSVSRVDQKRFKETAQAIRWAMHFQGKSGTEQLPIFEGESSAGGMANNPVSGFVSKPQARRAVEQIRKRIEERLKSFLIDKKISAVVVVDVEHGKLTIRLAAARFFDHSQAALRPESLPALDAIGEELLALNRPIRVEGHSDDAPVLSARYRNNWDLSAARAATVVSYLEQAHSIKPALLTASGHAATRPIEPNDTPEHRETNRRIELVIELQATDALNVAAR